jgi:hypothetical protein
MIQSEKENNNILLKKLRQFDRKVQTVSSVYYGSYFFLEHCQEQSTTDILLARTSQILGVIQ